MARNAVITFSTIIDQYFPVAVQNTTPEPFWLLVHRELAQARNFLPQFLGHAGNQALEAWRGWVHVEHDYVIQHLYAHRLEPIRRDIEFPCATIGAPRAP